MLDLKVITKIRGVKTPKLDNSWVQR